MSQPSNETPAFDDLNGDEVEAHIGEPVEPDHDVDPKAADDE